MNEFEIKKYSTEHEWVGVDGNKAYIGISEFAANSLGEIVYVELPELGSELNVGDVLGVVESVKAASDVYSPISGKVVEINEELTDNPEIINEDPENSWIAVLEISDPAQLDELMDEKEYEEYCAEEE
ncbi:MAG: glycine cleavage system protein GcvH [Clostridiaceae bacterium]|jgi:glycine cleavage system H protein|nr:glycine cleavage system protein GcvH [Clostridiaceae bacterium]